MSEHTLNSRRKMLLEGTGYFSGNNKGPPKGSRKTSRYYDENKLRCTHCDKWIPDPEGKLVNCPNPTCGKLLRRTRQSYHRDHVYLREQRRDNKRIE